MAGKLQGEVVSAWQDSHSAHIVLAVNEVQTVDGVQVTQRVEHLASLPLTGRTDEAGEPLPDLAAMDDAAALDVLLTEVKAKRAAQLATAKPIDTSSKPGRVDVEAVAAA